MGQPDSPSTSFLQRLGIDLPIVQAPMAGSQASGLAIAVSNAGGLGSLPTRGAQRPISCAPS